MGLRYRKSIRLGGGVRINMSGRGVGWSVGGKGFRYTKPAGGRRPYSTLSVPSTGIAYRTTHPAQQPQALTFARQPTPPVPRRPWRKWVLTAALLLLLAAIPAVGPYLFWVAVTVLVGRRVLRGRKREGAVGPTLAPTPPAWTPPQTEGPPSERANPIVAAPSLHQLGLADTERDAHERRLKSEQLRQRLDDLG